MPLSSPLSPVSGFSSGVSGFSSFGFSVLFPPDGFVSGSSVVDVLGLGSTASGFVCIVQYSVGSASPDDFTLGVFHKSSLSFSTIYFSDFVTLLSAGQNSFASNPDSVHIVYKPVAETTLSGFSNDELSSPL